MAMNQQIAVECSDVVDFACDVVGLKYAQAFYGADEAVASKIADDYEQSIAPRVGEHVLLPSRGKIAARQALFIGVPSLYQFDYGGIRKFAGQAMQIGSGVGAFSVQGAVIPELGMALPLVGLFSFSILVHRRRKS